MNRAQRRALSRAVQAGGQQVPVLNSQPEVEAEGPESRQRRVLLAFPSPGTVRIEFMESVLNVVLTSEHDIRPTSVTGGPVISKARNAMCGFALKADVDFLFMCDADMHFSGATLDALVALDLPIVGALYYTLAPGGQETQPVILELAGDHYDFIPKADLPNLESDDPVFKVAALGMGCTLIRRDVLEALGVGHGWPFTEGHVDHPTLPGETLFVGEDVAFCLRARDAGFESYVDTSVRAGHVKSVVI